MAGEDFQKGNQKRGKGLGLRDAIETTLSDNDSYLLKSAEELFNKMEIIPKVIEAIENGHPICRISFEGTLLWDCQSTDQFHGHHTYDDLFQALQSLLVSEGVSCYAKNSNGRKMDTSDIHSSYYSGLIITNFLPQ